MRCSSPSFAVTLLMLTACATAPKYIPTCEDKDYLDAASELKKLFDADQADRVSFPDWNASEALQVTIRDRSRRKRVAEIFAKGCLKSSNDYWYAALVFQHGEVPDHFFQTYIWSMRAVQLGKPEAKTMAANGIDRYLMNLGQKQLYGRQAFVGRRGKDQPEEECFCLWPVEETFPETSRSELSNRTLAQAMDWVKEMNRNRKGCESVATQCKKIEVKSTPRGSVPGVW